MGDAAEGVRFMDQKQVPMTINQWRKFWASHHCNNDQKSYLAEGIKVGYDPIKYELSIFIPFDPRVVGSQNHQFVDVDFQGNMIPQNNCALPGPFQNLKKGTNRIVVWDGLCVLKENALPDFRFFHR